MTITQRETELTAYWMTGCTSCLRMKEFLVKHGVPFISVNILEDESAYAELATRGLRSAAWVRRGSDWGNGQVLRDVARVAGIPWTDVPLLTPEELMERLATIQAAAQRFFGQIPEEHLPTLLPNRPRSYAGLAFHIFSILQVFLDHEELGLPWREGGASVPPAADMTKADILDHGRALSSRFESWRESPTRRTDFTAPAEVYYGTVTVHEFLERTTWHSAQHVRQLMMVLDLLGVAVDRPLGQETFDRLPMPDKPWDD